MPVWPFPATGRAEGYTGVDLYRKIRLAYREGMSERGSSVPDPCHRLSRTPVWNRSDELVQPQLQAHPSAPSVPHGRRFPSGARRLTSGTGMT